MPAHLRNLLRGDKTAIPPIPKPQGIRQATQGAFALSLCLCASLLLLSAAATLIRPLVAQGSGQQSSESSKQPPRADAYAGDAACASCHQKQAAPYFETAHHFTSQPPSAKSIEGSFSRGSNVLETANPNLAFEMNEVDGRFLQSALDLTDTAHVRAFSEPIDIVVGSGRKGHTYLYWDDDKLFELPVSYWTATNTWINSPSFPDGEVHFDLPIVPRCLDCHASYFESLPPPINRYRKSSLVLGISCEKCHGPGMKHVLAERSPNPPNSIARETIVNPAHLSRERQLGSCSLCHAGPATPIAPVLSYLPGKDINKYLKISNPGPDAPVDVHGNQVQLLRRSRCFQSSQMTCSTCHDVHQQQRDLAALSAKCMTCHGVASLGKSHPTLEGMETKCVSCHMPLQKSQVLFSNSNGQRLTPLVRTHRIAIYPDAARQTLTTQP